MLIRVHRLPAAVFSWFLLAAAGCGSDQPPRSGTPEETGGSGGLNADGAGGTAASAPSLGGSTDPGLGGVGAEPATAGASAGPGSTGGTGAEPVTAGTGAEPATAGTGAEPATAGTGAEPATAGTGGETATAGSGGAGAEGAAGGTPTSSGGVAATGGDGSGGDAAGSGVSGSGGTSGSGGGGSPPADAAVVINEFVASNQTGITDAMGGAGDWIELLNRTAADIDLGGYFVSDDPDEPQKAQLPAGLIIPAGGMLLLWADSDTEEGPDHLPFNLSKAGESVLISSPEGLLLDTITYENAGTDASFARVPDGTGAFVYCQTPTPREPNDPACAG